MRSSQYPKINPDKRQEEFVLIQDLVIPAGTVFSSAPTEIRLSDGHKEKIIGLSKDTSGFLIYDLDELDEDPELQKHFRRVIR